MQGVPQLIDRLEQAAKNAHSPLEERVANTVVWWYKNRERIPADNLGKRLEFQGEMITVLLDIIGLMVERQNQSGAPKLLRPRALALHDPIRAD